MKRYLKLCSIEGKLYLRSVDSLFFGIAMPIGILLLIGLIANGRPAYDGAEYTLLESSFGALITVGICATAFMGIPLVISDYRDKKILKHFFVTPVSPSMILLIHATLNIIISLVSAILIYIIAKLVFGYHSAGSLPGFILSYLFVLISMYSIGMLMASLCKSSKATNLVCTIVYFPMLFLSGATIPFEIFPKPLQNIAQILPLTQGIKLLKGFSLNLPMENNIIPILVLSIISLLCILISIKTFRFE